MYRLPVLLAALLVGAGCASHVALAPEERTELKRVLAGPESEKYLRVTSHVMPFFGDGSRRLLTPYPPEEVRLLNDTGGKPINPGPIQATLPAGARVRILNVEFPTAWAVTERVLYSPRTQTWVTLEVQGAPPGPPLVLVLPAHLKTSEAFRVELERYLTTNDVAPVMAAFGASVQEAILQKRALKGMPAEALEMAWGHPETIQRTFEEGMRIETWTWPGERRRVVLADGRVSRVEEGSAPAPTP